MILSLVEYPLLGWNGRFAYLSAKYEKNMIEMYGMDLVYLIAKKSYDGLSRPTDLYHRRDKRDTRSSKKIIADMLKKLGGE